MFVSSRRSRRAGALTALAALLTSQAALTQPAAMNPDNPTCPRSPNWGGTGPMRFTPQTVSGKHVLLAEGGIDDNLIPRLQAALRDDNIQEIWLRSPGGNAQIGNQAGTLIRQSGLPTRVPAGWACFSACNFLFMGGVARFIDPGGLFIVHMFTFTNNREAIRQARQGGDQSTVGLIGDIERDSALLASEDNDFLIRMGLSRALLTEIMYRQRAVGDSEDRSTMRCLTQDELRRYNVVNTGGRPAR